MTAKKLYRIPANSSVSSDAAKKEWPRMIHVSGNGAQTGERSFATAWAEDRFPGGVPSQEIVHYMRVPAPLVLREGAVIRMDKALSQKQAMPLVVLLDFCGIAVLSVLEEREDDAYFLAVGENINTIHPDFDNVIDGRYVLDAFAAFLVGNAELPKLENSDAVGGQS